ncbi:MAG: hypothetical protein R6U43_09655 [Candidatus Krumholzibacteriales bacterium]
MNPVNRRRIIYAAIFLTALSLFMELPSFLKFISGLTQVFVLPGLIFFFLLGDRERPVTDTIFFTPLMSPVLFSLAALLFTQLAPGFLTGVRLSAGLFYILFAVVLISGKAAYGKRELNLPGRVILLSCGYGALIALMYLFNDFLLIRSDSWYHASVVNEIITRGIPPAEPWLAGQPIRYMWIYHFFIAIWKSLSGVELFWGLGLFNIVSAVTMPYLVGRVISLFVSGARKIFYSTLIAAAGLESVSWIFFPVAFARALTGRVKGMNEILRIVGKINFSGQGVLKTLAPSGTWMVNLSDKYITITAFSFALNLFILCFIIFLSRSFTRRNKVRSTGAFFLVVAGTYLFHVVMGVALICTVAGSGLLLLVYRKFRGNGNDKWQDLILPTATAVLVFIIGLPYFLSLGGGESSGGNFLSDYLHLGIRNLLTILMPLIILIFPLRRLLRKLFRFENQSYLFLLTWIIPLLALNLLADLPIRGESKLIFPLFIMVGPVIGIEIFNILHESRGRRKQILLAVFLLLFLIPPALTFRGFLISGPATEIEDEDYKQILKVRYETYKSNKELFGLIESETGKDAVIMEKDMKHLAPVFSSRRNLAASMKFYRVYGYDLDVVRENYRINNNIFGREPLSEETLRFLKETDQDLFVLLYGDEFNQDSGLAGKIEERSELFNLIISHESGRLYSLKKNNDETGEDR